MSKEEKDIKQFEEQVPTIATEEEMNIWGQDKRDLIRKTFAPNLTPMEFAMFVGMGKSLGANPFLNEIWAVKYNNREAQIFLGRDFYRRKAQEQSTYNGHQVDAVYENDEFKMVNGKPEHTYNLKDRGKILGAYAVVYVEGREPFFNFVEFSEYNKGQSTWKDKPSTMIKKVAEAQALRGAFQGVFKGTYDESEQWKLEADNDKPECTGDDWEQLKQAVSKGKQSAIKATELWELSDKQKSELCDIEEG